MSRMPSPSRCASLPRSRPPPRRPRRPPAAQAPAALAGPADYQIGPSDILSVTVYGHPDLTQTILVQPDGTFTFPLVGRVKGSDMTPAELEKKLVILLARGFIRNPQVTVVVQEYRSKTVYVVGEVARPGPLPAVRAEDDPRRGPRQGRSHDRTRGPRWSWCARTRASPSPAPCSPPRWPRARRPRPTSRGPRSSASTVGDIQAGELEKNLLLQPNDTVFVPQAPKVFVSGEVKNPGAYGWFPGMTTRQLISVAGGLTPDGSDGRLKVVRQVGGTSAGRQDQARRAVKPGDTSSSAAACSRELAVASARPQPMSGQAN